MRHDNFRYDWFSSGRHLIKNRQIKIAVHGESERSGNRSGRHGQQMRNGFFFMHEGFALVDAESVLFVNYDVRQMFETDCFLDKRMCSD